MDDYRLKGKQWLSSNPLRQWRLNKNLFLKDVGAALNVGYHSVFRWENGMSVPSDEQMTALVKLTKDKDLQKKFQAWRDSRPKLRKV